MALMKRLMCLARCHASLLKCLMKLAECQTSLMKCLTKLTECQTSPMKCLMKLAECQTSPMKCLMKLAECHAAQGNPILLLGEVRLFLQRPYRGHVPGEGNWTPMLAPVVSSLLGTVPLTTWPSTSVSSRVVPARLLGPPPQYP